MNKKLERSHALQLYMFIQVKVFWAVMPCIVVEYHHLEDYAASMITYSED
jgi:hypothetical protein